MNQEELIRRLRKMIYILKKISPEQFDVFKQWLKNIVKPRLEENLHKEVDEIIERSKQQKVASMVSNLGKTLDNIIADNTKKGMEKQATNTAIEMGLSNETINKLIGLKDDEIDNLRKIKSN